MILRIKSIRYLYKRIKKNENHLVILSESASFPWGMAASYRVRNLSKAAKIEGWKVQYIGLRGAYICKQKDISYGINGEEAGIPYRYPGFFPVRPKNWYIRRIDDTLGYLLSLFDILIRKFLLKVDVVLVYSRNNYISWSLIHFLHFLRIPVIMEVCEWPLANEELLESGHKKAKRYCHHILPMADAVIPISDYIHHEIMTIAARKKCFIPSFKIPILIDLEDDSTEFKSAVKDNYMLYCGSVTYFEIAILIVDIVYELKRRGIDLNVKFTGEGEEYNFEGIQNYAMTKNIFEKFEFTGFIKEKKLFSLMRNSICLLAPLPLNNQSRARFSTKLGYYLASGAPVVTNAVGEIKNFMQDKVNAFLVEEFEATQFAKKIESIIENPELSKNVGMAGRQLALKKFHYTSACKGLGDFLHRVASNNPCQY